MTYSRDMKILVRQYEANNKIKMTDHPSVARGDEVIFVAPEGEWNELCHSVGPRPHHLMGVHTDKLYVRNADKKIVALPYDATHDVEKFKMWLIIPE